MLNEIKTLLAGGEGHALQYTLVYMIIDVITKKRQIYYME